MKKILTFGCLLVSALVQAADTRAGRDWSQMHFGINPSVSPDGSYFAFEWKDRVWLAPTEGGVATPIGDGMSADSRPFLSPDGKRVAFLSDRWGTLQLFEADLDAKRLVATGMRQITFHTEGLYPWGYTPDGADMIALAYRDDASENMKNKRISRRPILPPDATLSSPPRLTSCRQKYQAAPSLLHSGMRLWTQRRNGEPN